MSELYGAGNCGNMLLRKLSERTEISYTGGPSGSNDYPSEEMRAVIAKYYKPVFTDTVQGPLIQIPDVFMKACCKFRGKPNVGYIFFEKQIDKGMKKNLREGFDIRIAGSEWNAELMREAGFGNVHSIPQGVDCDKFVPAKRKLMQDKFIVFSGGKWEHRKGQDIVCGAVARLQRKYPDVMLIGSWFNLWDWEIVSKARKYAEDCGVKDLSTVPPLTHPQLAELMAQCDVGVFPNRAEGGTNLVMMEFMASGRPVIARNETGQRDVLGADYAWLTQGSDEEVLEQTFDALEKAYWMRGPNLDGMGMKAREAMKLWSWDRTADRFLEVIN